MDFTIDQRTGTPQQIAWVQQAIQACSYPLDKLDVPVTVTWAEGPCTLLHGYMCTEMLIDAAGAVSFTVYVEPWADDAGNINNRGLPNPPQDIQDFYKQSFVHELGHVVQYTLLNTAALRTKAGALFWTLETNSASGRRIGLPQDYSPQETDGLSWAYSIQEAIAECFKCAFYMGRFIYLNRTNWRIDEQEWPTLIQMLAPPAGSVVLPGGHFDDTFATRLSAIGVLAPQTAPPGDLPDLQTWVPVQVFDGVINIAGDEVEIANGVLTITFHGDERRPQQAQGEVPDPWGPPTVNVGDSATLQAAFAPAEPCGVTMLCVSEINPYATITLSFEDTTHANLLSITVDPGTGEVRLDLNNTLESIAIPALPFYLWISVSTQNDVELKVTSDRAGANVLARFTGSAIAGGQYLPIAEAQTFEGGVQVNGTTVKFCEYLWVSTSGDIPPPILLKPAYPFGAQAGTITTGPGSRGSLAVSA